MGRVALTLAVLGFVSCSSSSTNDSNSTGGGGAEASVGGGSGGTAGSPPDASTGGSGGGAAGSAAGSGGSGLCGGKDCLGGNCTNDKCEPLVIVSDADDPALKGPLDIAVDATHVYFTVNEYAAGKGLVMKASIDGGQLQTLATAQDYPYHVALDGSYVYWTNKVDSLDAGVTGSVMRVAKSGAVGAEIVEANEQGAAGVSVDDVNVYWVNHVASGTVKQKAKDGSGSVVTLASSQNKPYATACDPGAGTTGNLYFTVQEDGYVRSVPKGVSAISSLSDAVPGMRSLTIDGPDLFFGVFGSPGDVRSIEKAGGTNQPSLDVANGANVSAVVDIAVDATHVYFTTMRDTSGSAPTYEGSVMRAPRAGGPVELVWRNQKGPYANPAGIAVDEKAIYWTEYDAFIVYKLAK